MILIGAALWLGLSAPARAQGSSQNRRSLVRKIRLVGVKRVSGSKVRQQMTGLRPPPFWKFWQEGKEYTAEKLDSDLEQVQQLYHQEGYYQVRISPEITEEEDGALTITLYVSEGPAVTIQEVTFEIRDGQTSEWEERFRRIISLQRGKIFRVRDYEQSKTNILEYLANSGYPRARLSGRVLIYEKDNSAVIRLPVELGPLSRFGRIQVTGYKNISLPNIMREVTFAEGEPFSMNRVFQTQSRINGLGFFRSVLVNPVNLQEGTGPIDVHILLQERKPRTVEVGLGYGTEDRLRLRISGTYRNIFGGLRELGLSLSLSSLAEEEALTFRQPYFPDSASTSRWTLFRRKEMFTSFDVSNISNELRVERGIGSALSVFLAHRLDSSAISGLSEEAKKDQERVYFLSYFQTGFKWNTTDSPLDPTSGEQASFFIEPSLQGIGSEVSYVKGTAEYKRYYRLLAGPILAGRLLMGTIQPYGLNQRGVPIMKRFFSGGTMSVRGYDYQKLGPLSENQEPVGGNSLVEGGMELRFPLFGKLWGVTFVDFGNVFPNSMQFDFNDLHYSTGAGIRYKTIIGPLRLDYGYILNPQKEIPVRYRFHLSIGQAF
ncbi:MAG: outer membrane protein assembly factor BamA [bacterium]